MAILNYRYIALVGLLLCSALRAEEAGDSEEPSVEVDTSRLWLPISYQKLYLPLKDAAAAALALERCTELLEGTVDLEQSSPGHPIFRILCRQQNNRSYAEMVDGLSFETLTTREIPEPVLTEEELELIREAEAERKRKELERKKAGFWQQCEQALKESTRQMIELQWLTEMPAEPVEFDGEEGAYANFEADFDAQSIWGKPLQYRARCEVAEGQEAEVVVKKR